MGAPVDMVGKRFGRLTVIERGPDYESKGVKTRRWKCRCDCGGAVLSFGNGLRSGHAKSCGCLQKESAARRNTKHGRSETQAYKSWRAMWARCTNPKNESYPNYGARGITVCDRWKSFANFLADMGERPAGLSLDREKNELGYSPENCKWSTREEQENNKRNSVFVTIGDRTLTYSQWARELGGDPSVLRQRYLRFGTFDPQPRDYSGLKNLKRKSNGQYESRQARD